MTRPAVQTRPWVILLASLVMYTYKMPEVADNAGPKSCANHHSGGYFAIKKWVMVSLQHMLAGVNFLLSMLIIKRQQCIKENFN